MLERLALISLVVVCGLATANIVMNGVESVVGQTFEIIADDAARNATGAKFIKAGE